MEAGSDDVDGKRVTYVEDQAVVTSGTTMASKPAAVTSEETKEEELSADIDEETKETSESDDMAQRMRANWTNQFLKHQGWNYILNKFLSKEFNSNAAVTFMEQASLKDLAFRMTLLRVFLLAGFQT